MLPQILFSISDDSHSNCLHSEEIGNSPPVGPTEVQATDSADVIPDDDVNMLEDQVEEADEDAQRDEIAWSGVVSISDTAKFAVNAFQVCVRPSSKFK